MLRFLLLLVTFGIADCAFAQGTLVAVGGGGTTDEILRKTIVLAGGAKAIVAVLPQSSAEPDAGDESVAMWRHAGASDVSKIDLTHPGARAALERATLIWIPGGDQTRFIKAITGTGMDEVIRGRLRSGAVVGGTSAGAAVLSRVMITGDAYDLKGVTAGSTTTAEGLGLWPEVILDQHFLKRQRQTRLLSLVLDRPALVGIGVDESTAVFARGATIEVVGQSAVVVFDARQASVQQAARGGIGAAIGVRTHVLRDGMSLDLNPPPK
jgi:cyanophycinase